MRCITFRKRKVILGIKPEEINTIDNYEVLNVRNEVISVLRLARLFNIKESVQDEYCNIVIVGSKDKKVGIMVDSLIGEEDVVIKPLRDQFTNSPGIAGASILGDGSVSLIIDVGQFQLYHLPKTEGRFSYKDYQESLVLIALCKFQYYF